MGRFWRRNGLNTIQTALNTSFICIENMNHDNFHWHSSICTESCLVNSCSKYSRLPGFGTGGHPHWLPPGLCSLISDSLSSVILKQRTSSHLLHPCSICMNCDGGWVSLFALSLCRCVTVKFPEKPGDGTNWARKSVTCFYWSFLYTRGVDLTHAYSFTVLHTRLLLSHGYLFITIQWASVVLLYPCRFCLLPNNLFSFCLFENLF